MLEPGSPRSAVFQELSVRVKKVRLKSGNPLGATLDYLKKEPTDLIVLATEGREGPPRWFHPSVAERIAEKSATKTLFVPSKARGFVSRQTGKLSIRRMLVPIDHRPSPLPVIEYASRIAHALAEPTEVRLLHIGDTATMPAGELPEVPNCRWHTESRQGDVVAEIITAAEGHNVDLILMATAGHDGILDTLRGSVTEQVMRRAPCPLLAMPAI